MFQSLPQSFRHRAGIDNHAFPWHSIRSLVSSRIGQDSEGTGRSHFRPSRPCGREALFEAWDLGYGPVDCGLGIKEVIAHV